MARGLLEERKIVAIKVELRRGGSPWVALVAEEDPQGRGIGNLLLEAGAEGGEGREAVAQKNESIGRVRWQLSPEGRMSRVKSVEVPEKCTSGLCAMSYLSSHAPSTFTVRRSSWRPSKLSRTTRQREQWQCSEGCGSKVPCHLWNASM